MYVVTCYDKISRPNNLRPSSLKNGKYAVIRVSVRKSCCSIVNYSDHYFTALSVGLKKLTCGNDIGHVSNGQLTLLPLRSWKEEVKYIHIYELFF